MRILKQHSNNGEDRSQVSCEISQVSYDRSQGSHDRSPVIYEHLKRVPHNSAGDDLSYKYDLFDDHDYDEAVRKKFERTTSFKSNNGNEGGSSVFTRGSRRNS